MRTGISLLYTHTHIYKQYISQIRILQRGSVRVNDSNEGSTAIKVINTKILPLA